MAPLVHTLAITAFATCYFIMIIIYLIMIMIMIMVMIMIIKMAIDSFLGFVSFIIILFAVERFLHLFHLLAIFHLVLFQVFSRTLSGFGKHISGPLFVKDDGITCGGRYGGNFGVRVRTT